MPSTPVYNLPYQALADPPDGAGLGEDLALGVEDELARIDAAIITYLPVANIASAQVSITPVAGTRTSGTVSWGKTLPGTVRAWCTAQTVAPGTVVETSVKNVTSTGCDVWIYRTTASATVVYVIAIGL